MLFALLILGVTISCQATTGSRASVGPADSTITDVVTQALRSSKTLYILPRGLRPGSVDAGQIAQMRGQAFREYDRIYTGPLLESRRQLIDRYLDQLTTDSKMAPTRDGGVRELAFTSVDVEGDKAVATGSYVSWLLGEDPTSDRPYDEVEISAKRQFGVNLIKVDGAWRVEAENIY